MYMGKLPMAWLSMTWDGFWGSDFCLGSKVPAALYIFEQPAGLNLWSGYEEILYNLGLCTRGGQK